VRCALVYEWTFENSHLRPKRIVVSLSRLAAHFDIGIVNSIPQASNLATSTMSFQSDYTLTPTGFQLALPPIHQGVLASNYRSRMASPKRRRRVSLPQVARRGPLSLSRWLRRRSPLSQDSESKDCSTDDVDYDSACGSFLFLQVSDNICDSIVFQDDRFKPGLFFPHRAGPSVTFDEKTTVFYCSDEEQAGTCEKANSKLNV
jgi:hypothetical protein